MEHGVLLLVWLVPHSMDALPNQFPRSACRILPAEIQDGWIRLDRKSSQGKRKTVEEFSVFYGSMD